VKFHRVALQLDRNFEYSPPVHSECGEKKKIKVKMNSNEFDSLRRQATALERTVDEKLSQFMARTPTEDLESGPSALASQITTLLSQFKDINNSMAMAASKSSHELVLKRFREVSKKPMARCTASPGSTKHTLQKNNTNKMLTLATVPRVPCRFYMITRRILKRPKHLYSGGASKRSSFR